MASTIDSSEQQIDLRNQSTEEITPEQRAAEYAAVDKDLSNEANRREKGQLPTEPHYLQSSQ